MAGRQRHEAAIRKAISHVEAANQFPQQAGHILRHTHATMMLSVGIPAKVVSEMLGHSTIAITLDIYSHVTPGMQEDAAKAIDQLHSQGVESVRNAQ